MNGRMGLAVHALELVEHSPSRSARRGELAQQTSPRDAPPSTKTWVAQFREHDLELRIDARTDKCKAAALGRATCRVTLERSAKETSP